MASSSSLLCYLSLLSLLPFFTQSITIPLSSTLPVYRKIKSSSESDPYQQLNSLVYSSLSRAHHIKNPQHLLQTRPATTTTTTTTTTTPVLSHSYGAYSISLGFGTPPQILPFIMDTGSNLVWFPCTSHYQCNKCTSSSFIQSFIPKLSSSAKILGCTNPKCSWIHNTQLIKCPDCDAKLNSANCTQICPPYFILYGLGSTGGIAFSETLNLPNRTSPNFIVGCSISSSHQPAGIAGFGRGPSSLPSQLSLTKFSYCLLSRQFDDTPKSSSLVLETAMDSGHKKTGGVSYTPFLKNPNIPGKSAFSVYYYLGLRKISVGGRRVKIPYKYLISGSEGDGGTIIDSGTTFTFMSPEVFEPVAAEFISQVSNYSRAEDVEKLTGLRPCYRVGGHTTLSFPELRFHFKGGADMTLPLENYVALVGGDDAAACLTVVTYGSVGPETQGGPAVILGDFQTQNYYVEYDLKNGKLGFKQQICNESSF